MTTNAVQNLTIKSVDGKLEIRTRDRRMEGANESTELWRPPLMMQLTVWYSLKKNSSEAIVGIDINRKIEQLS